MAATFRSSNRYHIWSIFQLHKIQMERRKSLCCTKEYALFALSCNHFLINRMSFSPIYFVGSTIQAVTRATATTDIHKARAWQWWWKWCKSAQFNRITIERFMPIWSDEFIHNRRIPNEEKCMERRWRAIPINFCGECTVSSGLFLHQMHKWLLKSYAIPFNFGEYLGNISTQFCAILRVNISQNAGPFVMQTTTTHYCCR